MAGSPVWKVYRGDEYIASIKDPFYAAMIVAGIGDHTVTIRYGHQYVVWHEGFEEIPASESYDTVSEVCRNRAFNRMAHHKAIQEGLK